MGRTVNLIRHAQSTFNAAFRQTGVDPLHFDAPLSPLGLQQVEAARAVLGRLAHDVVITSPLTRAIQTTLGLFGAAAPIRVEALHRERAENSCDVGRSPIALRRDFPMLAFDHLDDPWWHDSERDHRGVAVEAEETLQARVNDFRAWLAARPERVITVVGHGTFLNRLTGHRFANCEHLAWEL